MESKTLQGIARTIHDRGEGDYDAVLAWAANIDTPEALLDGFDIDVIDWYFANLHNESVQDYPAYASEIGPAVDLISDAFRGE